LRESPTRINARQCAQALDGLILVATVCLPCSRESARIVGRHRRARLLVRQGHQRPTTLRAPHRVMLPASSLSAKGTCGRPSFPPEGFPSSS
jgi:hypothetical protein